MAVDFSAQPILTYAGNQDRDPEQVSVEDAGATLHLTGNNWKAIQLTLPFNVTPDSVIELDFKSDGAEGEINAIGLTNNIAVEYAQMGIRANAVAPGPIDTEMFARVEAELGNIATRLGQIGSRQVVSGAPGRLRVTTWNAASPSNFQWNRARTCNP